MTDLTIVYLKMRALAEAPQLMLSYRGESYRYRMAWDYFGAPWPEVKPNLPFRQLPMLVTEAGEQIVQSGSIMRYLAQRLGMTSADPLRAAAIDEIFEGSQELFFPLNPTVNFFTGDKFRESREAFLKTLEARLEDFERLLSRHDGPFFFGKDPVYCDFGVFHHVDLAHFLDENILAAFPRMQDFMSGMTALPGVSSYLATRPELIGVGVGPKLVIDGVAVSTGMSPD